MSAKRRLKKMQRQRRAADRGPRPPASGDDARLDDLDYLDDLKASFSNLLAHIMRNDGLALDQLPAGALAELLKDHACSTVAKNDAKALRDRCQAWYRWPVGNGSYIDLKLYQAQGRLQLPESLHSHAEVETVIEKIIFEHYIEQPAIKRALHERGAEAALDMIEAIPVHLYVEEDR